MAAWMGLAAGIDFGTSTTIVAVSSDDGVAVLEDESGSVCPSVVSFTPSGGELVGQAAKARRLIDAQNTLHSFKRIIGKAWDSSAVRSFVSKYPFQLEQQGILPYFRTRAGAFSPVDLCSKLMKRAFDLASSAGELEPTAIAAIPVEYDEMQRASTIEAAKRAGFARVVCVDEPLAIARAYLRDHPGKPRRIVVYDLGGGTFDVAICQVAEQRLEILATGGDPYLGGDDIDLALADWVCEETLKNFGWDFRTNHQSMARVLDYSERAKITLSTEEHATIDLAEIEPIDALKGKRLPIHRGILQKRCVDLVRRSFGVCDEVFAKAGLRARDDVTEIFLAGGSSRIPFVSQLVAHYFGRAPTVSDVPEHLVAIGAALIARNLSGTPKARVEARRSPRLPAALTVDVAFKDLREFQSAFAADISAGGLFIRMSGPPEAGARLLLRFGVKEQVLLALEARVIRSISAEEASEGRPEGVGLEFGMMAEADRQRLTVILEQIAARNGPIKPEERSVPFGRVV